MFILIIFSFYSHAWSVMCVTIRKVTEINAFARQCNVLRISSHVLQTFLIQPQHDCVAHQEITLVLYRYLTIDCYRSHTHQHLLSKW
ncbi:unnamed protein product [Dicrocoelium dendriticum]|nr:unnamed protein product [Dicrocoelium dendriticum]